jgi:hypothetical protein
MGDIYSALGMPDEEFTGEAQFHLSPSMLFKHLRHAVSKGCRFIILDTLFDALQVSTANDYAEVKPRLGKLNHFAQQHNLHILVVHHFNKTGRGKNQNDISGSAAIAAAMIHNILVSIEDEEDMESPRHILSVKNKYPESMGGKRLKGEAFTITETGCTLSEGSYQGKKRHLKIRLFLAIYKYVRTYTGDKPISQDMIETALTGQDLGKATQKRDAIKDLVRKKILIQSEKKVGQVKPFSLNPMFITSDPDPETEEKLVLDAFADENIPLFEE